jgi:hypothetical protein
VQDKFTACIDGGHCITASGYTQSDSGDFNQSLFSVTGLPFATHEVVLTNTPGSQGGYMDLDWALLEVGDGNNGTSNTDIWLDDSALGNFTYDASWTSQGGDGPITSEYYNSTLR